MLNRADVDRWLHWQSYHLAPAIGAIKAAKSKDFTEFMPLLEILDRQLEGKEFIRGDMSVVDFAIAPYLMTKLTLQIDTSALPNLQAWVARMQDMKGFVETIVKMPPG